MARAMPAAPRRFPRESGVSGGGQCTGFNLKGEAYDNVSLILTEGYGGLQGIVVIPSGGIPTIYPVRTN